MSDLGKITRAFWKHPKVFRAGIDAVGLWPVAVSWSKDHRTAGFIPDDALFLTGQEEKIKALVDSRLWHRVDGGYQFNGWEDLYPEDIKKSTEGSAAWIVDQLVRDHPKSVRDKLIFEVLALINEGVQRGILTDALERWRTKPNAPPSWLPLMVSDILRQGANGLEAAIEAAQKTGDVSPLIRFGHVFTPPDVPADIKDVKAANAFMLKSKKAWLRGLKECLS